MIFDELNHIYIFFFGVQLQLSAMDGTKYAENPCNRLFGYIFDVIVICLNVLLTFSIKNCYKYNRDDN